MNIDLLARILFGILPVVIFLVVLVFGLVTVDPPSIFLITSLAYAASGPIVAIHRWRKKGRA